MEMKWNISICKEYVSHTQVLNVYPVGYVLILVCEIEKNIELISKWIFKS